MKALAALLPLMTPTLCLGEGWLPSAMQERQASIDRLTADQHEVDRALQALGADPAPSHKPDASMPESPNGDTVAVADGGILFDKENSRIVYIDNVRLNDPRLKLICKDRLYIQFPRRAVSQGKEAARAAVLPSDGKTTSKPQQQMSSRPAAPQPPLGIRAGSAMADALNNRLYLIGSPSIQLQREKDRASLAGLQDGSPARMLADANGDILILSGELEIEWEDSSGGSCRMLHRGGAAYYRAENRTLLMLGDTIINTPDGSLSCNDRFALVLKIAEDETARKGSGSGEFMSQFRGRRVEGIASGKASGAVKATRPASNGFPASSVSGSVLAYNGETGDCAVSGPSATLRYGENALFTDGSIHLAANGDITLRGDEITGVYARPGHQPSSPAIHGEFRTSGAIRFIAATGSVHLPKGMQASDPLSSFSCGGPLEMVLQRSPEARVPDREKTGMLNLAIAAYNDIAQIHATGGIRLAYAAQPGQEGLSLAADTADLDGRTGEAVLTASAGAQASARYNGYRLEASSDQSESSLRLTGNGDVDAQGERISALLPMQGGQASVRCDSQMHLTRETGLLELGRNAHLESDAGILSSRGPLRLLLAQGDPAQAKPATPRFPHLTYHYAGLRQADTQEGGTLQSKQASMQCAGPIHIEMETDETRKKSSETAIRFASAEGDVALAGRDASGRMLSATGDKATLNGLTGEKRLTGRRVTLQDAYNTHIASGGGASVTIDRRNNARITGASQSTSATRIHDQIEQQKQKKGE